MVLETTWHAPTGWLVVHDLLVMGRSDVSHRRADYSRAPTNFGATGVLLRSATCVGGQVEVMVDCSPLFNYGTTGGTWSYRGEEYASMTVAPEQGDLRLDLAGNIPLGMFGIRCYGRTTLTDGQGARPPVAALPRAQRPDPQGAELRPDGRDHGRGDHLAARDPGRGAQLGLPLHLDPGLGVHAPVAV